MDEKDALLRIAAVAAAGAAPDAVFETIAAESSALLGDAPTTLFRYEGDGVTITAVVVAQTGGLITVGARTHVTGEINNARTLRTGRSSRIDDYTEVAGAEAARKLGMRGGITVPVIVDGTVWGALAVGSRMGPVPPGTEDRLTAFAEIAAAAVASAAARESIQALADEQAALLTVADLVTRGASEAEIFDAVAAGAANLVDNEATTLVRYEGSRTFTVLATHRGPARPGLVFTVPEDDAGTLDEMLRTWRSARLDRYATVAERSFSNREFGVGSSVSVPIVVNGQLWGSLGTLNEGRRLPVETERRLAKFAGLIGSALANVETRAELERFGDEQAALRRVAELAAGATSRDDVLEAVIAEASRLFDDATVTLWAPTLQASARPSTTAAIVRRVLSTGQAARIDTGDGTPGLRGSAHVPGVGVPVRGERRIWGVLVAVGRHRNLPLGAEDRLTQFAQIASTAVAGDRSRTALRRIAAEQAALRRVAELVARGAVLEEVFASVAREASSILDESGVNLLRYEDGDVGVVVATCRSSVPVGLHLPTDGNAVGGGDLHRARRPMRLARGPGTAREDAARGLDAEAVVVVPIVVEGRVWGVLSTTTEGAPPPSDAEDRLAEFAELAAAAIANAENRGKLRASRARVVAAADQTRQRLQRDVHDGAQQRLVQTVLTLQLGLDAADRGEDVRDLLREALQHAERATVELRDLVHGILPASLTRGGLRAGLESLIAGLAVPVELDMTAAPGGRMTVEVEVTAYFVAAEALTNVVKHAQANRATVSVAAEAGWLRLEIADDGVGGADPRAGSGLTGLSDRVEAMNGTLFVTSVPDSGTRVLVTLPVPDACGV